MSMEAAAPVVEHEITVRTWVKSHAWQIVLLVVLIGFLYRHAFVKLFGDWMEDPNYSHGFLVPVASIWIIWLKRKALGVASAEPRNWGLAVIGLALMQFVAGTLGAENFVAYTSLLVLLAGVIAALFGTQLLRQLLFPIGWLVFMIPLPAIVFYSITFPLQLLASRMASGLLDLLQIPNLREGNVMYFSNYTIGVAEACSGIRSLITLMAFAVLLGYLRSMPIWARIVLALSSVPVALVVNAIRVASAGALGNYLGEKWAEGMFHTLSGMVLFLLALLALAGISSVLAWGKHSAVREASI